MSGKKLQERYPLFGQGRGGTRRGREGPPALGRGPGGPVPLSPPHSPPRPGPLQSLTLAIQTYIHVKIDIQYKKDNPAPVRRSGGRRSPAPVRRPAPVVQPPCGGRAAGAVQPPVRRPAPVVQPPCSGRAAGAVQPPVRRPAPVVQPPCGGRAAGAVQPPVQLPASVVQPPVRRPGGRRSPAPRAAARPASVVQPPCGGRTAGAVQPPRAASRRPPPGRYRPPPSPRAASVATQPPAPRAPSEPYPSPRQRIRVGSCHTSKFVRVAAFSQALWS